MKTRKFNIDVSNFLKVCSGILMHPLIGETRSTGDLWFNPINSGTPGRTQKFVLSLSLRTKAFLIYRIKWLFRTGEFGLPGEAV